MENDIYITKLPGAVKSEELCGFLDQRLNAKCTACVKPGKIPNTTIAFCSIGGHDVDDAIERLQNADYKGSRIKVVKYVKTDKNRRFADANSKATAESRSSNQAPSMAGDSAPVANGKAFAPVKMIGVVVHVVSIDEFYVQIQSDCQKLQMICSQMLLFDVGQRIKPVERPTVGKMYAACYSADKKHYRALVLSEPHDDMIDVHFVDFGNKEVVDIKSLVKIEDDIGKVDYVAKRCRFAGVKVLDADIALQMLNGVAAGDKVIVEIFSETLASDNFTQMEIDLLDEKEQSLKEAMVAAGALEIDPDYVPPTKENHDAQAYVEVSMSPMRAKDASDDAISPVATCIISHVDSAESFCIQGAFDIPVLPQIYNCLQNCSDYPTVQMADAVANHLYCAQFSLDGRWYRCVITWNAARKPIATFVDFGNSEVLNGVLKELPEEIALLRPQALKCQLAGLKILNPEAVKVELTRLSNEEVVLKFQIQKMLNEFSATNPKDLAQEVASVDFAVEGKYRSFCSWLIEKRLAERMYQHKPTVNNQSPPSSFGQQQAPKRNRTVPPFSTGNVPLASQQQQGKKRSSLLPTPPRKIEAQSRHANSSYTHVDRNAAFTEILDEGIIREKLLSDLTDEIGNAYNLRFNLMNWRSLFGVESSTSIGKSLIDRLDQLRNLKESSDESEESGAGTYGKLIALWKSVLDIKASFFSKVDQVKKLMSEKDETSIMTAADERDELATALVEGIEKCSSEYLSNVDAFQRQLAELKDAFYQIEFVLDKCPALVNSEKYTDFDNPGRKLWSEFVCGDKLRKAVQSTDAASARMETTRNSLSFITGKAGPEVAVNGPQSVKSFFPHLDDLNKAMNKELETYNSTFISGSSGKLTAGCLALYKSCVSELLEELKELEKDLSTESSLNESEEFAKSVLSAKTALTDDTISKIEATSQKIKKARSQLRHHLADLEDLMELESDDQEVDELRQSIDKIRIELHSDLLTQLKQKSFITNAFKSRPESAIDLVKLLKVTGPSICDSDVISSWETSYFNLKPLNVDQTLYESKFGEQNVLIKKMLITDDGSRLRQQIAEYQDIISTDKHNCFMPIVAAFVPLKETHVLYTIVHSYDSYEGLVDAITFLKLTRIYLIGISCLHSNRVGAAVNSSILNHVGKIKSHATIPDNTPLLKPSIVFEAEVGPITLSSVKKQLRLLAENASFEMSRFENIFQDVKSMDEIENAVRRVANLILEASASEGVSDSSVSADIPSKTDAEVEEDVKS